MLLPVQRVPRYRLLLESLAAASPADPDATTPHPAIQTALDAISLVAAEMNERKRESEGRQMLIYWQNRIGNRFRSPLVQPHRSLIKQGTFTLVRTVKKAATYMDVAGTGNTPPASVPGSPVLPPDVGVMQIQSLHTELQQQELVRYDSTCWRAYTRLTHGPIDRSALQRHSRPRARAGRFDDKPSRSCRLVHRFAFVKLDLLLIARTASQAFRDRLQSVPFLSTR